MSTSLDLWLLPGENLTTFTVTPMQRLSTGALSSVAAAQDIRGVLDESSFDQDEDAEDIAPVTSVQMNSVQLRTGSRMSITTLKRSDQGQKLTRIKQQARYARVQWVEGVETNDFYFRCGPLNSPPARGRGAQRCTLNFLPVGFSDGTAQGTRTASSEPF